MFKQLLYILTAIFALSPLSSLAQEKTFTGTPLVREGSEWCFRAERYDRILRKKVSFYYYQYIKGDTILNGVQYKKLYEECTTCTSEGTEYINQTVAFMREENGRVSVVQDTAMQLIGSCGVSLIRMKLVRGENFVLNKHHEYVLYDFNDIDGFLDECDSKINQTEEITDFYAVPATDVENLRVSGRTCYDVHDRLHPYYEGEYTRYMEGVGFDTNIYKYHGDLTSFYFFGIVLCAGPHPQMVYMKNPEGEYEFMREEFMPSGIDLLKHTDMKVTAGDGHIAVSLPDYVQSGMLEVIDLNGRVVATQAVVGNHADMYLKHHTRGMYVVQFRADGHLAVRKVIL